MSNKFDQVARTFRSGITFSISRKYPSKENSPLRLTYRFGAERFERSIGVSVKGSEWNDRQECLHQNDDRQKRVQAVKDVMNGINRTLFSGKSISSAAIAAKLDETIYKDKTPRTAARKEDPVMKVGEVWKKFYDLSFTYKRGGSAYVSLFHGFVQEMSDKPEVPTSKHFEKWIKDRSPSVRGQVLIAILAKQVLGQNWVSESGRPMTITEEKQYATVKVFLSSLDNGNVSKRIMEACEKAGLPVPKLKRGRKPANPHHTSKKEVVIKNGKKVVELSSIPNKAKRIVVEL